MSLKEKCPILRFADLGDERGKLVVIEGAKAIPFEIKRVFYIYGSDPDVVRGQHANRESEFVLINVAGTSKVRITDGIEESVVELNEPMMGIYIPKMIWKDMYDFSSDSVLLVLASTHYDGAEYIRNYEDYTIQQKRKRPLLSLCIPTNGVLEWVLPVLDSIYEQNTDHNLFEVILTDNGSDEEFKNRIIEYAANYDNLYYYRTKALPFINEIEAYKRAHGELIKFVNHRTKLKANTLNWLIEFAEKNKKDKPIIYFSNGELNVSQAQCVYREFDAFVRNLSYWSSWSTGMAIWKEDFENITKEAVAFNELFPHTTILFHERSRSKYIIDNSVIFQEIPQDDKPKGNYDLFFAFGVEFPGIIFDLLRKTSITVDTYRKVINDNLSLVTGLYLDYVIRGKYSSYDLNGLNTIFHVFYSRKQIIQRLIKVVFRRINKRIRQI